MIKFAPQKTAQIPISRGDGASFSDKFRAKSKDSDLSRSKAARSQDVQTAHGQNFNGARRFSSGAQEAPGGAQKGPSDTLASSGEGILKFRLSGFICPRSPSLTPYTRAPANFCAHFTPLGPLIYQISSAPRVA